MTQVVFLDTNIILDYIENRNSKVRDVVAQLLLFHQKGTVVLATSVFNVAELIDKEFEIHFIGDLMAEKLSYDEIYRQKGDKEHFREVAENKKQRIKQKIEQFIFQNEIEILTLSFKEEDKNSGGYVDLYELIYKYQFSSQDALMIATALNNNVTFFLSNDSDLIKQINNNSLIDTFNLRDEKQREDFKNTVLDNLTQVLK